MATRSVRNVIRAPGKLIKDPTNLSAADPYGGTELGVVRNLVFRPGHETEESLGEEFGRVVAATLVAERAVFACVLRSWDNDMLAAVFPNTAAPTKGRFRLVHGRASGGSFNRAGYALDSLAFKLLFVPFAVEEHPALIMYNAVPMVDESAEIQMSIGAEYGLALMFKATPDATGRDYTDGSLSDLAV